MRSRRSRRSRRPRRTARWLAPLLTLLLVVAAAGTAYRLGYVDDWLDRTPQAAPTQEPDPWEAAATTPPSPSPVAAAAGPARPDPAKVRAALAGVLADDDLGPHVLAEVAPLAGGAAVFTSGRGAAVPASTTKLLTAVAALEVLGPETTFTTRVVQPTPGQIVLVGGGDPLLGSKPVKDYPARADLRTLAAETATTLRRAGVKQVRLGFDDSLFGAPTTSPRWPANYVPDDVVAPITALWADQGNDADGRREADPSQAAAAIFAGQLRQQGIAVRPSIRRTTASGAAAVASMESAPLREIVQHTLETSDNDAAEVLAHHVGVEVGGAGTFGGGVAGTRATLTKLGVPTAGLTLYDGSGLSRDDRIAPATLTAVLQVAARKPELASVLGGLPVASFTGSLVERFEDAASTPALGLVRAKTGTLTGVNALAGTATDLDGDVMTFVIMTDRVSPADTLDARQALDDAAAALAGCHCASAGGVG